MISEKYLSPEDYVIIGVSLVIPVLIGLKFWNSGGKSSTAGDYFLAGRDAKMLPVVLSAAVTALSAITLMSVPADSYRFGPGFALKVCILPLGQFVASFIFIPVYFRCGVSSIYELLEKRFGKYTRYTVSALFIVQTVLYMCMVLLAPVLTLNAITKFSIEISIIMFGAVCTFYCVLGGLKAVLWTDVFQSGLMFACLIIVYVVGISEVGGVTEVTRRASAGKRLHFFDFNFDFETRYTFWNCICRALTYGACNWGTSQLEVQRSLSMSDCKRAQRSIFWSTIPVFLLLMSSIFLGIILYAVFFKCDPVLMVNETGISKYDQIVPYFIVSRLHYLPGLAGLCIAGIFSGSLSTMSSALNSLATVTVVDFVQPAFPTLTDARELQIGKLLGVFYGVLSIALTFLLFKIDSVVQATVTFISLTEGPVLALFLIGVLTRKVTDKSAVLGLLIGVSFVGWICFGTLFGGFRYPPLPLETSGCPAHQNTTTSLLKNTSELLYSTPEYNLKLLEKNKEIFSFYKIPFTWIGPIGCFVTLFSLFVANLILDRNRDVIPRDSECLSHVVRYFMNLSPDETFKENNQEVKTELQNICRQEISCD